MKSFFHAVKSAVFIVALVISGAAVLTSCAKNHTDVTSTPVAGLMAFNLSTDKSVGFSLSGSNLVNSPLSFGNYTGNYLSVYPGQRSVDAYDFSSNSGTPLATAAGNFEVNKYYSVFFLGSDSSYKNVLVTDNFDSLSSAGGQSYIRYINAIPDSVNVPFITVAVNGTNVINNAAGYGSISQFTAVNPGDISITASSNAGVNVSRTITVEAKKVYTILIAGVPGSGEFPVSIKYIPNGTLEDSPTGTSGYAGNNSLH